MTTTRTFEELLNIDQEVGMLYALHPQLKDTKFGYAYKRFADKGLTPSQKEYLEELQMLRLDHAMVDPTTKVVMLSEDQNTGRGFQYDKEGLKALLVAERELFKAWKEKAIEVTPFISTYTPPFLNEFQTEMLEGLVIPVKQTLSDNQKNMDETNTPTAETPVEATPAEGAE